ncbi:TetR family transcriptional regulator [Streptomyces massasporeus]|uniref:TetR family transcriptional regulator n=1 Tax=Streptomyces massasporeus TaxID=67324 RepID=UPI0037149A80
MKINSEAIARTALRLLDDVGLDGLTMRLIAQDLGVRAPTLYWRIKNKQELLDAMATPVYVEAAERLEPPRDGSPWEDWLAERPEEPVCLCRRHVDLDNLRVCVRLAGAYERGAASRATPSPGRALQVRGGRCDSSRLPPPRAPLAPGVVRRRRTPMGCSPAGEQGARFHRSFGRKVRKIVGMPECFRHRRLITADNKTAQVDDLGLNHGAGDENRTRALSLGS